MTGGGALLALPFLYAAYRKKLQVDVRERDAGAGQVPRTDRRWCTDQPQRTGQWLCTGQAQCARSLRTGCFFAALAGMGACLVLNVLLQLLFPLSDGWDSTREAVYGTSIALQLLVTVVLAPLTEELLFRGLIRAELRTHMKPRTAALMGALLFGMYHGNISQGMYEQFFAPGCMYACGSQRGIGLFYGPDVRHVRCFFHAVRTGCRSCGSNPDNGSVI